MLDDFELSRRVLFVLGKVEHGLGIQPQKIPLRSRLENALMAAMHSPLSVEAVQYGILYWALHQLGTVEAGVTPTPDLKPIDHRADGRQHAAEPF